MICRCGTESCIQRIMNAVCDELIIPLPDFTDSLPKRPSGSGVRRNLLLQKSTSLDQTPLTDNFIPVPPRRMPSQNGLRLDGKPLLSAPNQTSPFGRHRFQRQRSSIECAPSSLQRSNSSSQLTKSASQKPENIYESKKRALAPMGNLSQPPQKVSILRLLPVSQARKCEKIVFPKSRTVPASYSDNARHSTKQSC